MNEDAWVIISAHFWPKFEFNVSVSAMSQIVSYSFSDSSNNDNKAKYSVVNQRNQLWLGWGFRRQIFVLRGLVYTVSHNIVSETILSTVNKANIFITIDIPQHLRGHSLTHPPSPHAWYGALSLQHMNVSLSTPVDSDHFPHNHPSISHCTFHVYCR